MFRNLTTDERRLLSQLGNCPGVGLALGWLDATKAESMLDGGMGSLRLAAGDRPPSERRFGRAASELEFVDSDGTRVIATLHLDQCDQPFELDMWKVDFSPLQRIPERLPPPRVPTLP